MLYACGCKLSAGLAAEWPIIEPDDAGEGVAGAGASGAKKGRAGFDALSISEKGDQ